MNRGTALTVIVFAAALACHPEGAPGPSRPRVGSGVATVDGEDLTASDLHVAPGADEKTRRRALDQVILRRLAAAEARRRGLDAEPELAEQLVAIQLEAKARQETLLRDALFARVRDGLVISEDALRAHYEATKLRYADRQIRLLRRPAATRAEAERVMGAKAALEGQGTEALGPSPVRDLPRTVLPEALRLDRPGARAVAGSDEEGWSLIELAEVRPAEPRPLDAVRAEVEASLRQKQAATAFRALLDVLRANADVRVDEEALARVSQSGQGEGQGARPGRLSDRPSDHGNGL